MFTLHENDVLRHAARASDAQLKLLRSPKSVRQIDESEAADYRWWQYWGPKPRTLHSEHLGYPSEIDGERRTLQ